MRKLEDLKRFTNEFFRRHWSDSLTQPIPTWNNDWKWKGSVPYHDKGGVYALFDASHTIVYIGLGASVGGGLYKAHGISRRLLAHVITTDRTKGRGFYIPQKQWSEVAAIGALGFPTEYAYLAPALEDYLIGVLNPTRNNTKKRLTITDVTET